MSQKLEVCSLEQLKREHYRVVEWKDLKIAVYFHDQAVYAFEDRCTHNPSPLSGGAIEGDEIICIMHGARFNIKTGAVTMPPARCNLRTFPVSVVDGEVLLVLPPRHKVESSNNPRFIS